MIKGRGVSFQPGSELRWSACVLGLMRIEDLRALDRDMRGKGWAPYMPLMNLASVTDVDTPAVK